MTAILAIRALLFCFGAVFLVLFIKDYRKNRGPDIPFKQKVSFGIIGGFFNFLDTLGIGCFAPIMSSLKLGKLMPDKLIPGSMNVACSVSVTCAATIFLTVIEVDTLTLVSMLTAAIIGAFVGVGLSSRAPERILQFTMGLGLAIACIMMLAGKFGILPVGGEATGLTGVKLIIGVVSNFFLGMLLPLGIGNYAPCMAIIFLLGMHPVVSFPIMMGSGAFAVDTAGIAFARSGAYHRRGALWMAIFAVPGVFIAAYIVKSMPLNAIQWLVIVVCVYTSITLFRAALKKRPEEHATPEKASA